MTELRHPDIATELTHREDLCSIPMVGRSNLAHDYGVIEGLSGSSPDWGAKLQPIEKIELQRNEKELSPVLSGSGPDWGMEHQGRTDTGLPSSDHL